MFASVVDELYRLATLGGEIYALYLLDRQNLYYRRNAYARPESVFKILYSIKVGAVFKAYFYHNLVGSRLAVLHINYIVLYILGIVEHIVYCGWIKGGAFQLYKVVLAPDEGSEPV